MRVHVHLFMCVHGIACTCVYRQFTNSYNILEHDTVDSEYIIISYCSKTPLDDDKRLRIHEHGLQYINYNDFFFLIFINAYNFLILIKFNMSEFFIE